MFFEGLVEILRETATKTALAKDRIFFSYLTSRNLVDDYEQWVGELNNDKVRMQTLVLGDEDSLQIDHLRAIND